MEVLGRRRTWDRDRASNGVEKPRHSLSKWTFGQFFSVEQHLLRGGVACKVTLLVRSRI